MSSIVQTTKPAKGDARHKDRTHSSELFSRVALGSAPFVLLGAAWLLATEGHFVDPTFLPSMKSVALSLFHVFTRDSYIADVWTSVYRVMAAFIVSAIVAIPLGLLTGHKKAVANTVEPFVGFVRYMPVPAFVPLCILWFGIGDAAKIVVIFLGTFFQLILLSADVARTVPKDYFEAALTLGASQWQLIRRILWPASLPGVVSASRTAVGWAWTYLVVAEIAGATSGIGFRIMQSQRYVETPKVFAGILVIGLLGMVTDLLFQVIQRLSFGWE